jgi:hypothetical protein
VVGLLTVSHENHIPSRIDMLPHRFNDRLYFILTSREVADRAELHGLDMRVARRGQPRNNFLIHFGLMESTRDEQDSWEVAIMVTLGESSGKESIAEGKNNEKIHCGFFRVERELRGRKMEYRVEAVRSL